MRRRVLVFASFLGFLLFGGTARADLLPIGVLSFDNPIADAPGQIGVNAFDITNLTGDTTGFLTPTAVTFLNATLSLSNGSVISLGDIAAQATVGFPDLPAVQFPTTDLFTSAEFKATLSISTFLNIDGTTFYANSSAVDVFLAPSPGKANLVAGTDFALINVSNVSTSVPEPATWLLGIALLWAFRKTPRASFDR